MAYRYFNPNPNGKKVGDCVIRGISFLTSQDWEKQHYKAMKCSICRAVIQFGANGARIYPVAPNVTALLFDFVTQTDFEEVKNQLQQIKSLLLEVDKNATVNAKSNDVSAEVQRICQQITEQQGNAATNGTTTA